ncbi:MAG: capsular biosynthesis protein [Comamonas sp.]|jgi:capsular polysaccharide export protein|uniref:capsule biosynthesis protein n=1 Tax=Comamonas sp. TaxID=34028 RepID=UPI00281B6776|nr:capsular biosynthesis protein [Comamonas sp.]MDR0215263.1 capsular biosynthesis protein [Comamonas sp.]
MKNKSGFASKRVLLLQGPVGPFFWNLAKDLRSVGATVFKFNFNAGDWLFYPREAHSFKGELTHWPVVLETFIVENGIDAVVLFGDCRPVHACVRALTERLGCALGVFEEGYLRPDHVTFEPMGVNGHSSFEERLAAWLKQKAKQEPSRPAHEDGPITDAWKKVGNSFWHAAVWGMLYFFVAWLGQWFWNNALHHRRMTVRDSPWWWLSYLRKFWYRRAEKKIETLLLGDLRKKFFLAPLQVYNDAQILVHSDYEFVTDFINHVLHSFSRALKQERLHGVPDGGLSIAEDFIVFKHHPMDRGHRNYANIIRLLARRHGLQDKVLYIHDQHLPSLLKSTKGVVLVNSTTGLSALGHGAPVKVCGSALYDLEGLTFQGRMREFWFRAHQAVPDKAVLSRFRKALIECTQINGSFYRKLPNVSWQCGAALDGQMADRLWGGGQSVDPASWPAESAVVKQLPVQNIADSLEYMDMQHVA